MSAGCRRRRRVADTSAPTLQSTNQNTNDSTVIVFGNATTPLDPHEIHTQSVTDTTLEFWKTSWSKFLQTLTCTSTATHADADDEKSVFDVNVQERISQRTVQRQKKLSLHALVLMERSHAHRGAGRSRQGLRRGLPLSRTFPIPARAGNSQLPSRHGTSRLLGGTGAAWLHPLRDLQREAQESHCTFCQDHCLVHAVWGPATQRL